MEKNTKRTYIAPEINVSLVELEEGIAIASAEVVGGNTSGQILEEWEIGPDDNRDFEW